MCVGPIMTAYLKENLFQMNNRANAYLGQD